MLEELPALESSEAEFLIVTLLADEDSALSVSPRKTVAPVRTIVSFSLQVPARMYMYCVVESAGSAATAPAMVLYVAQVDPTGPTTKAVVGMDEGKHDVGELVEVEDVVDAVDTDVTEDVVDTDDIVDADDVVEVDTKDDVDELVKMAELVVVAEPESAALAARIALNTFESIQSTVVTATLGYADEKKLVIS